MTDTRRGRKQRELDVEADLLIAAGTLTSSGVEFGLTAKEIHHLGPEAADRTGHACLPGGPCGDSLCGNGTPFVAGGTWLRVRLARGVAS